ncbi:MAG: bifunctional diaminohydroxyphosphoribosylaminopyrimidine deaminase/5-amino-6-(5-phosphoribosylamino)uracil reductase RibD [Steroidobacteraceae bacterium]|jgi:diaminohydroxyphosphoribosylaminopyrimidine deaminase/5-amino-6-(5-phosphoribosylamino)uracil reductase
MRRALALAARGLNTTDPNPRVGCVLVRDGGIIAEGWHERAGEAHAEVFALRAAGAAASGATAYVTLEPCAHTGRTPPCTDALIAAGVHRVVYAIADPNPRMRGGAEVLGEAGIQSACGLMAAEARALNPGFFKRFETGLPWVRVKLAASLDGRTALASGESRWITGKQARADAQHYRARSAVVLSGSGTILADDPKLNVRVDGTTRQPLRVVLDTGLRTSPEARVYIRDGEALIFTASDSEAARTAFEAQGVHVQRVPRDPSGGLSLRAVLESLGAAGCNEVWVEAGARLAGAFLQAGLVDELVLYLAPCLLGADARPLAEIAPLATLDQRLTLNFSEVTMIGSDLRITARPVAG